MWFLVLVLGAWLSGTWLAAHAERRLPPERRLLTSAQIWIGSGLVFLAGLLGARLFYMIQHWEAFRHAPLGVFAIWLHGRVWYGALLGGALAGFLYVVRSQRLPFLGASDHVIPFVALGHALGRIGCFLDGCCRGKFTTSWFGVPVPGDPTMLVVPVQLLESAALVLLYVALRRLQTPALLRRPGLVFGVYLLGYATVRFLLEFWRAHQPMVFGVWTVQQLISLGVWLVGMALVAHWVRVRPTVAVAWPEVSR
jgi:phosphatidylglycerol:prolipoprotein diacylglycerol transferase